MANRRKFDVIRTFPSVPATDDHADHQRSGISQYPENYCGRLLGWLDRSPTVARSDNRAPPLQRRTIVNSDDTHHMCPRRADQAAEAVTLVDQCRHALEDTFFVAADGRIIAAIGGEDDEPPDSGRMFLHAVFSRLGITLPAVFQESFHVLRFFDSGVTAF
ncbi:MAG: hypothetical protein U0528_04405 [Anaerolineae bacterium]